MSKERIKYIHIFIWLFAIFANLPYTNFTGDMPLKQLVIYIAAFLYLMGSKRDGTYSPENFAGTYYSAFYIPAIGLTYSF